jgi:hypothetical protein
MNARAPVLTLLLAVFVASGFLVLAARGEVLSSEEMKLLQDADGWEYISISDSDNGVQTHHVCFDGHPHPEECSGTLTFTAANTFAQKVHIHGQTVQRNGKYEVDGDNLALFDELGTKDGPYATHLNLQSKSLVLETAPVRIELELENQYREDLRKANH